jgi:hypothetical protein
MHNDIFIDGRKKIIEIMQKNIIYTEISSLLYF